MSLYNSNAASNIIFTTISANTTNSSFNPFPREWEEEIAGTMAVRPVHPALPWQACTDGRVHRPHRWKTNQYNCPGRTKGMMADRGNGSWRSEKAAMQYLEEHPIPDLFELCTCGCACECDGQAHFIDDLCACYYLRCPCVKDQPDEPRLVA